MERILITGGTGFVGHWMRETYHGSALLRPLNRQDYDKKDWKDSSWDYIVHLAPVSPYDALECALDMRNRINKCRILFASSGAVYERTTEYADNKRAWELECILDFMYERTDVVIARLFTFYGKYLDEDKALSRFIKAARAGEPIVIYGDGSTVRSYMSGEEMGKWLWAILFRGESGEAYDVGSDVPYTMMELAQMVNKSFGNRSEIVCENRPDDCPYYMPKDTAKTRRLLDAGR